MSSRTWWRASDESSVQSARRCSSSEPWRASSRPVSATSAGSSKKWLMESSKTWRIRKRVSSPTLYSPFSIRERSDCVTPIRLARSDCVHLRLLRICRIFWPTRRICEGPGEALIENGLSARLRLQEAMSRSRWPPRPPLAGRWEVGRDYATAGANACFFAHRADSERPDVAVCRKHGGNGLGSREPPRPLRHLHLRLLDGPEDPRPGGIPGELHGVPAGGATAVDRLPGGGHARKRGGDRPGPPRQEARVSPRAAGAGEPRVSARPAARRGGHPRGLRRHEARRPRPRGPPRDRIRLRAPGPRWSCSCFGGAPGAFSGSLADLGADADDRLLPHPDSLPGVVRPPGGGAIPGDQPRPGCRGAVPSWPFWRPHPPRLPARRHGGPLRSHRVCGVDVLPAVSSELLGLAV